LRIYREGLIYIFSNLEDKQGGLIYIFSNLEDIQGGLIYIFSKLEDKQVCNVLLLPELPILQT